MSDSLSFYILFLTAEVPFSGGASIGNRPFNRYGGHIELIGFKKYYGIPRIRTIRYTRISMYAGFSGRFFFLSFPRERLLGGKKDRCAVFGCNSDILVITFFSRNIQWSSLFARKARVNTERVPPGHPIILLKPNKFNIAAVSVKRSITGSTPWGFSWPLTRVYSLPYVLKL